MRTEGTTQFDIPVTRLPGNRPRSRWGTVLLLLVVLAALAAVVPYLVYQVQYSLHRGRLEAERESAAARQDDALQLLQNLSQAYQAIAQQVGPAVVAIESIRTRPPKNPVSPFEEQTPAPQQGSGVVVEADGVILTSYHVVQDADKIKVTVSSGTTYTAKLVGHDDVTDLAVLKIEAKDLPIVQWAPSSEQVVGSVVFVLGSPFGLQRSVTLGILSGKDRSLPELAYSGLLQTDAAVNPGNSGGPLLNVKGEVIGINSAIVGRNYQGVGFAVPSEEALKICKRLKADGRVSRGWIGVILGEISDAGTGTATTGTATTGTAATDNTVAKPEQGAVIVQLLERESGVSPAADADLHPGDIVTEFDGTSVQSAIHLYRLVTRASVETVKPLVVWREGKVHSKKISIAERPARTSWKHLGLSNL